MVYYNEIDPFAAAWLGELIQQGHIADGIVDTRSIEDVLPADLAGFAQCHFFAGIGGWSYALRLAGWPDDRPIWTGSCPCQPFSAAGKQHGFHDTRHLWPAWHRLIRESRPDILAGEQVASAGAWLDLVSGDLEGEGYTVGSCVLGAHSVGAPHIRQRIYWVADRATDRWREECPVGDGRGGGDGQERWPAGLEPGGDTVDGVAESLYAERGAIHGPGADGRDRENRRREEACGDAGACGEVRELALPGRQRSRGRLHGPRESPQAAGRGTSDQPSGPSGAVGVAQGDTDFARSQGQQLDGHSPRERFAGTASVGRELGHSQSPDRQVPVHVGRSHEDCPESGGAGGPRGVALADLSLAGDSGVQRSRRLLQSPQDAPPRVWAACDWLPCRDGKYRPVEPGTFPLAHGVPARVGRLRGYGNAVVPQTAAAFLRAYLAVRH